MESTTHQLSTYPHLIPVDAIPDPVYQATSLHRRSPEIRRMSNHDIPMHRRSGSFSNLDYQDIIARYNDTATKHSRMVSESTTSEDDINDRKGELRYDFRFGGDFDRRDTSFKPLRDRRDRNSAFTVASARTLCSLSPESSPPVTPSSHSPPSISEEFPMTEHGIGSHSTLTPMLVEKYYGLSCRIKAFLIQFFRLHPNTTMIKICSHKFRHGRCRKCDLPEAILPYLNGGMRAGFHCKDYGCERCSDCASTSVWDTCGSEEDLHVAPLRIRSSMVASLLYADTPGTDTGSRSTISDEAPQIGPLDFIPTAQRTLTNNYNISESNISSTDLSSESFFESSSIPYSTPEPFSSPTDYSLSIPPYLPTHDRNTSTPCPRHMAATSNEDLTTSPRSTDSNEVLEIDVSAIAVPIVQVSPTTIQIRHSKTASQPPETQKKLQSLHDVAHNAVHGDLQSQIMILKMYQEISSADTVPASPRKSESDCHLIRKTRLVLGLQVQQAAGRMPPGLVEKVSVQLLSRDRNQAMRMEAFAAYICKAVVEKEVSETRGAQILALAEDEG